MGWDWSGGPVSTHITFTLISGPEKLKKSPRFVCTASQKLGVAHTASFARPPVAATRASACPALRNQRAARAHAPGVDTEDPSRPATTTTAER